MSAKFPAARDAALARISSILDDAAHLEHVSPTEFRAEIANAIAHARSHHGETLSADCTVEEFVLSLVSRLF